MTGVHPPRIKRALAEGHTVAGPITAIADPALVEMCAHAGLDFYMLDFEHGSMSDETAEHAVRAGNASGISVLARLPQSESGRVGRFLDAGGDGVLFAHVSRPDQVAELVQLTHYAPIGRRGAGPTRVARQGLEPTTSAWLEAENDGVLLGIQIEDREALTNAEALITNAEVDAIFPGPRDLSIDLGVPGEMTHPSLVDALARISELCTRFRKPLGAIVGDISTPYPEDARIRLFGFAGVVKSVATVVGRDGRSDSLEEAGSG